MTKITKTTIKTAAQDERWLGYGYLGERDSAMYASDPECRVPKSRIAKADSFLITEANRRRWDYDTFFYFVNSKFGRWFAEDTIYGRHEPFVNGNIVPATRMLNDFEVYLANNRSEFEDQ